MTTIAFAILSGIAVLLAGSLPWSVVLAPANLRIGKVAPWSILPMAVYLWGYWKYISGSRGSPQTAGTRRVSLRANALPDGVWGGALCAGLLGFAALVALIVVMGRMVSLPAAAPITPPAA